MKCNLALCLRETIDVVFILRSLQEEYHSKGKKLYMYFVDLEKAFDRVPRKVLEWALRQKEYQTFWWISEECMREQRQESEWILSCQRSLRLKWGCTKDLSCNILFLQWWLMLSLNLTEGVLIKLLYADDLVLMCETIKGLMNKFLKWKEAFESKGLKVSLGKTKANVSGGIARDGLSKSKVVPCRVCCLRIKANSVLCDWWIHDRCAE